MLRVLRNDVKSVTHSYPNPPRQRKIWLRLSSKSIVSETATLQNKRRAQGFITVASKSINVEQHRTTATGDSSISSNVEKHGAENEAPKPPLAIVFTDIVKSTAIWEKNSSAMTEAMVIHDDLVRNLSCTHGGYEVKQNGDGFMIAFQSAISALNFCLDIQTQLQDQKWPEELLKMAPAESIIAVDSDARQDEQEEKVLWKGLRLRMSAHFGKPVCMWNDVIQRMDYLGPAVNRAARFVSVCEGGQIIVSAEFLLELMRAKKSATAGDGPLFQNVQAEDLSDQDLNQQKLNDLFDSRFEVRMLGNRHFKGVAEKQQLFFIVPKSLQGRLNYFPQHKYVQASKGNLMGNGG